MNETTEERILQELSSLHLQISRLHNRHNMRHGWLGHILHDLEYNPKTQYKVHIVASYVWIISAIPVLIFFFGFPNQWVSYGVLITLIYSLYANFATDYGAASAALAAMNEPPLPEIPTEQHGIR